MVMAKKCPNCGKELEENPAINYCPHCQNILWAETLYGRIGLLK